MNHPIPDEAYESAPKKAGLRLAFNFCCFAVLHDAGIGLTLCFNECEGVDEDSGDVDIGSAISFWSWNRRFCLAMTDSFLISKEMSSLLNNGLRMLFDAVRSSWNPGSIMSLPKSPRKSKRNRSVFFADMPVSALAFLTVESDTRHRFSVQLIWESFFNTAVIIEVVWFVYGREWYPYPWKWSILGSLPLPP